MSWRYKALFNLPLPPPEVRPMPESPIKDCRDVEWALNALQSQGWEFVGFSQKYWHGQDFPQTWWVFRRPSTDA